MDLISHGLFFGAFLYFYVVSASSGVTFQTVLISISIFIYSVILELRNHLDDFQVDLSSGTRTTVCWLGYEKSLTVLKVLLIFHWLCISAVSVLIYPGMIILTLFFTVLFTLPGLSRMRFNRYLRLADICTCILYVLILIREFNTTIFQPGGNS